MSKCRRAKPTLLERWTARPLDAERLEVRCQLATVTLQAVQDNTLFEDSTGGISNGAGDFLFVGRTGQPSGRALRRTLLAFDVAELLPAGATVQSASLSLSMTKTISGPQQIGLHRVLAPWGEGASDADGGEGRGTDAAEGDATWTHRVAGSTEWQTPGGDFVPTASATTEVNGVADYVWSSDGLVTDLQYWLAHPDEEFGWLLSGEETATFAAKQFASRENSDSTLRPELTIEYTLPSAAGWKNTALAEDVSGDGIVSPLDALLIINVLNGAGGGLEEGPLPSPPQAPLVPPPFVDVNGDNQVVEADALLVFDYLNAHPVTSALASRSLLPEGTL
jgi:hypothetical protein